MAAFFTFTFELVLKEGFEPCADVTVVAKRQEDREHLGRQPDRLRLAVEQPEQHAFELRRFARARVAEERQPAAVALVCLGEGLGEGDRDGFAAQSFGGFCRLCEICLAGGAQVDVCVERHVKLVEPYGHSDLRLETGDGEALVAATKAVFVGHELCLEGVLWFCWFGLVRSSAPLGLLGGLPLEQRVQHLRLQRFLGEVRRHPVGRDAPLELVKPLLLSVPVRSGVHVVQDERHPGVDQKHQPFLGRVVLDLDDRPVVAVGLPA